MPAPDDRNIPSSEGFERFALALEATDDGLWDWDISTGDAYFSPRYYTMLGYAPYELPQHYETWERLVHPEDLDRTVREIQRHIDNHSDTYAVEFRLRTKGGDWRWILGRGKVIERDAEGKPVRMVGTHQDVTNRKKAEAELTEYRERLEEMVQERTAELEAASRKLKTEDHERREAEIARDQAEADLKDTKTLLETMLNAIPDVLGIQDRHHRIIRYNAAGYQLLKMHHEEVAGKCCFELVGRTQECDRCATSLSYESRQPEQVQRYDETLGRWLDVRAYPVLDDEGNIINIIEHLRDITPEKEAEAARQKLEKQLQQAQKMEAIGTLAGGIAHDFNNLLMGILGNVSLMLSDPSTASQNVERLKNIEQYILNGSDLTRQLLGFARGGKYEVLPTDMNELVDRSLKMFGRTKKEISVHLNLADALAPIAVDQSQIDQVLLNIFVNAWQAMPGGGELYVSTANVSLVEEAKALHLSPGPYVRVRITDTGIGMDADTMERAFDPFFTTKEKDRGTGLGLASAYGIIRNHDGALTADSEPGKGATFTIYLPAADRQPAVTAEPAKEVIPGSETILLVDDEEMILEVTSEMLRQLGYEVLVAYRGEEAIEKYTAKGSAIDAVILDMIMPDMNGSEIFDQLKALDPDVTVLLSTGYSISGQAAEIMDRGCRGFIQKPFTISSLSQKLRQVLDNT